MRYVGTTATGAMAPIGDGNTTFTEWAPCGATLLLRSATALSLRAADGTVQNAALASFHGPVHGWTADSRLLVRAMSPTVPGGNSFDHLEVWSGADDLVATIPNLLGARSFSPDGRSFAGVSRTGLYTTQLELYRCGVPAAEASPFAPTSCHGPARRPCRSTTVGSCDRSRERSRSSSRAATRASTWPRRWARSWGRRRRRVVDAVGWVPVGGFRVSVMHAGGLESCDYHISLPLVANGDRVVRGQPIALVGTTGLTTGPHVHWEAKLNGRIVDPLAR